MMPAPPTTFTFPITTSPSIPMPMESSGERAQHTFSFGNYLFISQKYIQLSYIIKSMIMNMQEEEWHHPLYMCARNPSGEVEWLPTFQLFAVILIQALLISHSPMTCYNHKSHEQ